MTALLARLPVSFFVALFLDLAVKSAVLLALAALLVGALRRASAATRHLLWFLATVAVLLLPALSAALPAWRILPLWTAAAPAQLAPSPLPPLPLPADAVAIAPRTVGDLPAAVAPSSPAPSTDSPAPTERPRPVMQWRPSLAAGILLAYLAGVAALLARLGLATLSLRYLQHRATPITAGPWSVLLAQLRPRLSLRRPIQLLATDRRAMPMTWGLFRIRLLLPADASSWTSDHRRAVLLHELAHAQRHDCLTQLVTQLACALHWYNPLVWLASRQMQILRERACDDRVLAAGTQPAAYAQQLLHLASQLPAAGGAVAIAMARPSALESRLRAILDTARNRKGLTAGTLLVATAIILAIALPLSVLRAADPKPTTPASVPATAPGLTMDEVPAAGGTYRWTTSAPVDSEAWFTNGKEGQGGSQAEGDNRVELAIKPQNGPIKYSYRIGRPVEQGGTATAGTVERTTSGRCRLTAPGAGPLAVNGPTPIWRIEEWDESGKLVTTRELRIFTHGPATQAAASQVATRAAAPATQPAQPRKMTFQPHDDRIRMTTDDGTSLEGQTLVLTFAPRAGYLEKIHASGHVQAKPAAGGLVSADTVDWDFAVPAPEDHVVSIAHTLTFQVHDGKVRMTVDGSATLEIATLDMTLAPKYIEKLHLNDRFTWQASPKGPVRQGLPWDKLTASLKAPATRPKADYSTARQAALAYLYAYRFTDVAALRDTGALDALPDSLVRMEEARMETQIAEWDLEDAALQKFGPHEDRISDSYMAKSVCDAMIAALTSGPITTTSDFGWPRTTRLELKENGDVADLTIFEEAYESSPKGGVKPTEHAYPWARLYQRDGRWRVTAYGSKITPEQAADLAAYTRRKKALFAAIAADIRSGKLATFDAAAQALEAGWAVLRQDRMNAASTEPATRAVVPATGD